MIKKIMLTVLLVQHVRPVLVSFQLPEAAIMVITSSDNVQKWHTLIQSNVTSDDWR